MKDSKRAVRKGLVSPKMRKKLDALGKALGTQMAEDLAEYGLELSDLSPKATVTKKAWRSSHD